MKHKMHMRTLISFLFIAFAMVGLTGCEALENQLKTDRSGGLEKQDYRDALAPRDLEFDDVENAKSFSKRPSMQPYIAHGTSSYDSMPLVSIAINRSVPLRDIFYQLAEQAGFDIELDPRIRGSVIFTAKQRPFDDVVKRICDMAGLRYNIADNMLRVELDTPFNTTYKIDYVNQVRNNSSSISTDISVVSGDGADTGSSFSNSSVSETDFWGGLEASLENILANASINALKTINDPQVSVVQQNVNLQAVGVPDANGRIHVSAPSATLTVESVPDEEITNSDSEESGAQFVVNRQSGLINVFATQKAHDEVQQYLVKLKKAVTAQVLVEAKILEVFLRDEFASGIDWRALDVMSGEFVLNYLTPNGDGLLNNVVGRNASAISSPPPGITENQSNFAVGYVGNDIQALVRALAQYGTIKALASPRLTVLNNQAAVLNVATNRVFFEIDIDVTTDDGTTQTEIESEIRNVPEGVLVNVQPSINMEDGTISMAIRPTVTRVTREVLDPGVQFVTASNGIEGIENRIPEINVQEIDSVIQMRSGQPVVMGGLLQDLTTSSQDGVPILNELPLLGSLFRTHTDSIRKSELVIFLKATILDDPSDSIHNTDRDLYRKFSNDRRPFKM